MDVRIEESWKEVLNEEFTKPYFTQLVAFVKHAYEHTRVYPEGSKIFAAFEACSFFSTKVVIIGQDPYHGKNQAIGLCFAVQKGIILPPSLKNIFKELKNDLDIEPPSHGDLSNWAKQGVLLLNATLTVEASKAGSHQNKGWEQFTDTAIEKLSKGRENLVFILWGAYAQKKGEIIDTSKHLVLKSPHPSPFSANRGFLGSKPFSKTNDYLKQVGKKPIHWDIKS